MADDLLIFGLFKPPLNYLVHSYMQDGFFWIKKTVYLEALLNMIKKGAGPKNHHKLYSVRGLFI